ncbi:MAG: hypothetical protein R2764_02225 [Bacteroidales bacterium]
MNNISKVVIQQARQQGISLARLARMANLTTAGFYKMINKDDFKVSRVIQLSRLLNYDLLQHIRTTPTSQLPEFIELKHENKQLKQTIETLRDKNNLLTDFVQVLKSQKK